MSDTQATSVVGTVSSLPRTGAAARLAADARASNFSMAEARHLVEDLFQPKPWIYWTDFLVSYSVAMVCFGEVRKAWSWWIIGLLFVVSSLLIYRCSLFIHEIVHLRSGSFRVFRVIWNLLFGIPFLVPSFLYYTHLDHHRRSHFGTKHDGEYIPLGAQSPWAILWYLCQPFFVPALAVFRFLVLTPLTWINGRVRRWVYQHASSMIMDPAYVRPLPTKELLRVWRLQEVLAFLFCAGVAALVIRGLVVDLPTEAYEHPLRHGFLRLNFLVHAYLTGTFIVMINNVRTLGAHRFINDGRELTFVEQLLDSVNYPKGSLLAELWGPVGLRYHALHHLFPSLPYHNLGKAHARLMAGLPADSPYRQTNADSLWQSLVQLWRASREAAASRRASLPPVAAGATVSTTP